MRLIYELAVEARLPLVPRGTSGERAGERGSKQPPHPCPTAIELRSADFSPPLSGPPKTAGSGLKSALLSCRNSLNSMAVHPCPLPSDGRGRIVIRSAYPAAVEVARDGSGCSLSRR